MIKPVDDRGSFITEGRRWSVLQPRGAVTHRQELANKLTVTCYAEAHLNAHTDPSANYAMAIVAHRFSEPWGRTYTRLVSEAFGHRDAGVVYRPPGYGLVSRVRWPAPGLVLEPGFLSNPDFAFRATTGEGIDALGKALADSIIEHFPDGGLVALSIGHAYRGTGDKGANVHKDHNSDPAFDQEAEIAEAYVKAATQLLTNA